MATVVTQETQTKRRRLGVNLLGILGTALLAAAMFYPWWAFRLAYTEATNLYPYLIDGPGSELMGYKRSPQMELLTGVLIGCIVLCLVGSLLRGRWARILMALSGLLVFLAAWRLMVRIVGVAARFELPVQGHGWGNYGGFAMVEAWTWIQPGLYLALAGAALAVLAAIIYPYLRLEV